MTWEAHMENAWVASNDLGIKVNKYTGQTRKLHNGKAVALFRNKQNGTILVAVPYNNTKGKLGKGKLIEFGKAIMYTLIGLPETAPPRSWMVNHINGNRWDFTPSNLGWITRKEYREQLVVAERIGSLSPAAAVTLKQIVEGSQGLDHMAVGNVFGISALMVTRIRDGLSWGFVSKSMKIEANESLEKRKMTEILDLSAEYKRRDEALQAFMSA